MHLNVLRARGWLLFLFGICLLLLDFVLQHVCHVLTIATSSPVCWPDPLGPCPILLQQVYFCAFAAVKCCSRRTLLLNMALGWLQCFSPAQSSLRQDESSTQKSTHFPVPVPSSTRTICLVFARNQIFLCRQANKMALPARKKQEQECKHKTTAAAKTAPCLQSFAVKKLKNKVK